jgi:uncharacterized protein (DUF1501 family)
MKRTFDASRRRFLATASALSAVGPTVAPFALNLASIGSAAAQSTCSASDYKALVCIYLSGGNDSFNMVIPTDDASFAAYQAARDIIPSPILIARSGSGYDAIGLNPLVPLPGSRPIALHPEMTHAAALFDAGRLAIVPNVGPLTYPIASTAEYNTLASQRKLPVRLFSHNDQSSAWQAFGPEGTTRGWGGRLGDLFASCNGVRSTFTSISATGNVVFLAGDTTMQYQVTTSGAVTVPNTTGALYGAPNGGAAMARIAARTRPDDHLLLREQASITKRSIDLGADLGALMLPSSSVPAAPTWRTVNPNDNTGAASNSLSEQLRIVARIIGGAAKSTSGIKRQVFMVQLGGFDTHDGQPIGHARLMGRLSQALDYFNTLLARPEIDAADAVTVFTASEFGRTFGSNGDGTDHGWGAHHLVMGAAVDGGKVHGVIPEMGLNAPRTLARGSMIPAIAVDQYAGHLARWFGASPTNLASLFPNLSRFSGSAAPSFFKA